MNNGHLGTCGRDCPGGEQCAITWNNALRTAKCGHQFHGLTCDMQAGHGGNSHAGIDEHGNCKWQHMLDAEAAPTRPHINADGQFQSDKYPTCPPGKVPLSVKDPTAQDLLWEYAQRRRAVDPQFADDLEWALIQANFTPATHVTRAHQQRVEDEAAALLIARQWTRQSEDGDCTDGHLAADVMAALILRLFGAV